MEFADCPECGAPAEVEVRSTLPSTGGQVVHVRTYCVNRHWFLMARDRLGVTPPEWSENFTALAGD